MFRGLTKWEQRITLSFIAGISILIAWYSVRTTSPAPLRISGPALQHEPGDLVHEPTPSPPARNVSTAVKPVSPLAGVVHGRIDINVASAEVLEALPGIGPVKAKSIVEERTKSGPYLTPDDLQRVRGIGPKTAERLAPMVFTGVPAEAIPQPASRPSQAPAIPPDSAIVLINTATQEELQTLEGVGPARARAILEDREINGPFENIEQLTRVKGIGPVTLDRNRHRLRAN